MEMGNDTELHKAINRTRISFWMGSRDIPTAADAYDGDITLELWNVTTNSLVATSGALNINYNQNYADLVGPGETLRDGTTVNHDPTGNTFGDGDVAVMSHTFNSVTNVNDGDSMQLRFTFSNFTQGGLYQQGALNNLVVDTVPEPETYALILGGIVLGFVILRRWLVDASKRHHCFSVDVIHNPRLSNIIKH